MRYNFGMKLGQRVIEPIYTTFATSCDSIMIPNLKFKKIHITVF